MFIWTENLLPADITLDIFSRLPAESVLQCRQVCKTWGTLLHHPDFADMHLRRSLQLDDQSYDNPNNDATAKLSLLLFIRLEDESNPNYQLCYYEYDENDEGSYRKQLKMINCPPVQPCFDIIGSCNGLIYFSLPCFETDPIYICNPITREYVILPKFDKCDTAEEGYPNGHVLRGFGYLPSTNEYKIVRISFHRDGKGPSRWYTDNEVDVQVYTLGSGSGWRKIKSSSLPKCMLLKPWAVLANGVLYWLGNEGKSVSFDLADEEVSYIQSPPYVMDDYYCYFQVWGRRLCFVHRTLFEDIDIWAFKKNKKIGTTTNDLEEQEYQSWGWSKEFTITGKEAGCYEPFALTKSGEVLMSFGQRIYHKILSRYDSKTATSRKLDTDFVFSKAIPHVNSFVSLKALGEDAKIIEPAEGLPELLKLQDWY